MIHEAVVVNCTEKFWNAIVKKSSCLHCFPSSVLWRMSFSLTLTVTLFKAFCLPKNASAPSVTSQVIRQARPARVSSSCEGMPALPGLKHQAFHQCGHNRRHRDRLGHVGQSQHVCSTSVHKELALGRQALRHTHACLKSVTKTVH